MGRGDRVCICDVLRRNGDGARTGEDSEATKGWFVLAPRGPVITSRAGCGVRERVRRACRGDDVWRVAGRGRVLVVAPVAVVEGRRPASDWIEQTSIRWVGRGVASERKTVRTVFQGCGHSRDRWNKPVHRSSDVIALGPAKRFLDRSRPCIRYSTPLPQLSYSSPLPVTASTPRRPCPRSPRLRDRHQQRVAYPTTRASSPYPPTQTPPSSNT